jgi:hypothetical protein
MAFGTLLDSSFYFLLSSGSGDLYVALPHELGYDDRRPGRPVGP